MADIKDLAEQLVNLTVKEVNELAGILKDEYGIEPAAAPVAVAAVGGGGGAAAEPEEEKTEFDVVLTDHGPKKINVIKAIRALTSLGLKEAKEAAEGTPTTLMEGVAKETAEDAKKKLEEAGGKAEIK